MLEAQVHLALEKLSNGEPVEVKDEWIDDAAEMFKEALKKQLRPEPREFYIRMSNVGRPSCQLQMEKAGEVRARNPYNHVLRMLLGDATEAIMEVVLRAAGLNITGGKSQVSMEIEGVNVKGTNDIEIDDKVFDTKSASPWAFTNKWTDFETLQKDDPFGYVSQLVGYSLAQGKQPGGWIVVNKASGEVKIIEVNMPDSVVQDTVSTMRSNVLKVSTDAPFEKCFKPEEEKFRGKPTGSLRLGMTCTFCPFLNKCWPEAVFKPQTGSQAQSPKYYWYTKYNGSET